MASSVIACPLLLIPTVNLISKPLNLPPENHALAPWLAHIRALNGQVAHIIHDPLCTENIEHITLTEHVDNLADVVVQQDLLEARAATASTS
jgi:hypothetical protein